MVTGIDLQLVLSAFGFWLVAFGCALWLAARTDLFHAHATFAHRRHAWPAPGDWHRRVR